MAEWALAREKLRTILEAARSLEETVQRIRDDSGPEAGHQPRATDEAGPESEAAAAAELTAGQRRICERVINVFETGTIQGRYGAISIYRDGPNRIRQITYGRSQTTEYGNLGELVEMYAGAGGLYSASLRPYVGKVGRTPLTDDATFKDLLRRAGNEDPVMKRTQDIFFDRRYFQPALGWARNNGFARPLSILVIYDSFIHSGSIRRDLRERFPERPPAQGGDEKTWIGQYVEVRHHWLTNHSNPEVRPSNYRTRDLGREIAAANWDLAALPIMANGVAVDDAVAPGETQPAASLPRSESLAARELEAAGAVECEWSELEPPAGVTFFAEAQEAQPIERIELASRILSNPNIVLATVHFSGVVDQANARQCMVDTAAGLQARRSTYGTAPGGAVWLDVRMLRGLLSLAETCRFHVSELCGGSHSANSRHYRGLGVDVNIINGQRISASHPDQAAFRMRCRDLGATEVLGPGAAGHATHIHAAWPNP